MEAKVLALSKEANDITADYRPQLCRHNRWYWENLKINLCFKKFQHNKIALNLDRILKWCNNQNAEILSEVANTNYIMILITLFNWNEDLSIEFSCSIGGGVECLSWSNVLI